MKIDDPKQFAAAAEFKEAIIAKLANEKGVHAETAISAAARMAGTFLLRSTGLPLDEMEPGTSVLFEAVDEQGQQVLGLIGEALPQMGVPFDASKVDYDLPEDHNPLLNLMETQALLDAPFREIAAKFELGDEEAACSMAIAAAVLTQNCAGFLDPHIAYVVAAYGMVEGSKTVPFRESESPERAGVAQ